MTRHVHRPVPNLSLEHRLGGRVCGIDEVGRGPLAGPVVAACVYIPENAAALPFWAQVRDSKQLSATKRDELTALIRAHALWGIGAASVEEIDRVNILQATFLAMGRAFAAIGDAQLAHALVDGNRAPALPVPVMTVIKGDQTSLSIAAASIIAKVHRDELMTRLHAAHPAYGWAGNAGYGTPEHLAALVAFGPTIHHRQSFAPVRNLTRCSS